MNLLRKVKDKTYSPIEVKVREATSNDKWGAPLSLQREIASYTHDPVEYPKLFAMLWKRLTDHEHLTHVQKALILLHYLLRHGSSRLVEDAMARKNDVARLQKYKHYTGDKEDAAEARQLAKQTFSMLNDPAVLSSARKAAAGEKKGMPVASEDEPEIDEVERAAEKKRAAAMAKIPSKKAEVPTEVNDDEEEEEEEENDGNEENLDDDDEEAKRAAAEIQAALAATEPPARTTGRPTTTPNGTTAAVAVKKQPEIDFFASLGGDPWSSGPSSSAPVAHTASPPVHAAYDPFEALATRQPTPTQQMANLTISSSAAAASPSLANDPFAPIPVGRSSAPAAAARPAQQSSGFLDGTEW